MKYSGKIPGAPNFTYEELIHSDTADRYNLDNTPKFDQIWVNLAELAVNVLQPLRDHFGEPIVVTSGYRCAAVNRAVGGSMTSFHASGCAADIRFESKSSTKLSDIFKYVYRNLPFSELIAEGIPDSGWVHVAYQRDRLTKDTKYMLSKEGVVKRGTYQQILQYYGSYHV